MTAEEVERKFLDLTVPVLGERTSRSALAVWYALTEQEDLRAGLDALERPTTQGHDDHWAG